MFKSEIIEGEQYLEKENNVRSSSKKQLCREGSRSKEVVMVWFALFYIWSYVRTLFLCVFLLLILNLLSDTMYLQITLQIIELGVASISGEWINNEE